jgi:hypothetical protein
MSEQQSPKSRIESLNLLLSALDRNKSPILINCIATAVFVAIFASTLVSALLSAIHIGELIKNQLACNILVVSSVALGGILGFFMTMRFCWRTYDLRLDDYVFGALARYEPTDKVGYLQLQESAKKSSFLDMKSNIYAWAKNEKASNIERICEVDYTKSGRDNHKNRFIGKEI